MRKLYEALQKELSRIDFEAIWPGFRPAEFALYNDETAYFAQNQVPRPENFRGNTALQHQGQWLAIWHVAQPQQEDPQIMTANMVHEIFHGHQMQSGESRFPDDIQGTRMPDDPTFYQQKLQEGALLCQALDASCPDEKRRCLQALITLRNQRKQAAPEALAYELAIETIEGSAEFCGTQALAQLNPQKYSQRLADHKALVCDPLKLLNTRHRAYTTGTLLHLAMTQLSIPFETQISQAKATLFEYLEQALEPLASPFALPEIPLAPLQEALTQRKQTIEDLFQAARSQQTQHKHGPLRIAGYDPMNLYRKGPQLLHKHFVMLQDPVTGEAQPYQGPVITEEEPGGSGWEVREVWY